MKVKAKCAHRWKKKNFLGTSDQQKTAAGGRCRRESANDDAPYRAEGICKVGGINSAGKTYIRPTFRNIIAARNLKVRPVRQLCAAYPGWGDLPTFLHAPFVGAQDAPAAAWRVQWRLPIWQYQQQGRLKWRDLSILCYYRLRQDGFSCTASHPPDEPAYEKGHHYWGYSSIR